MKVVTDNAAELSADELNALNVIQAPLYIQFPEGEVASSDLSPDDFYNKLAAMFPQIPTTAQPSSGTFAGIYNQITQKGEDILSVHISSGLSGTLNSANLGSQQAEKPSSITVFDTLNLSGGQRFHVQAAAWAARAGWPLQRILERLEQIRAQTETVFTLEKLDYLARGGRIGRVQALAASILKVKPVICVDHADGKYNTVAKTRTIPQALESIANFLTSKFNTRPLWVNIMHGQFLEPAENLTELLQQKLNIARLDILRVTPVLGVHTGPGVVGASVTPMELMQDLAG